MRRCSVFVCETHPIAIEGLRRVLSDSEEFELVGAVNTSGEVLPPVEQQKPDLLLLDQSIGLRTALQLIGEIRNVSPQTRGIMWVNELAEPECLRCLQAGARGVVRKNQPISVLYECLRSVAAGGLWLEHSLAQPVAGLGSRRNTPKFTPREREIVEQVCRGLKNKQIAEALSITPGTVKVHLMHIFEKAGVRDRFELAVQGGKLLSLEGGNGTGPSAGMSSG